MLELLIAIATLCQPTQIVQTKPCVNYYFRCIDEERKKLLPTEWQWEATKANVLRKCINSYSEGNDVTGN